VERKKPAEALQKNHHRRIRTSQNDWAYLSYLKATGQIPALRFTVTVEIPNRDSRKINP
jgi:hypothetical protein